MCGKNGGKRGNCIGYRVAFTKRTVEGILTALETYCVPRKNTTYERYVFRMTIQEDRSFDIFDTDLRRKAEYCDFGAIKGTGSR